MMMAPVQLWNPTELVSAAAAAAARNCTQTPLCLGSKFRDADDDERERECFLSQIPWKKLFPVQKRIKNFRECCFSFLLVCCNDTLSKLRNLYSSRSFRAPSFEPKT
jgi:hypothetical protein